MSNDNDLYQLPCAYGIIAGKELTSFIQSTLSGHFELLLYFDPPPPNKYTDYLKMNEGMSE